MWKRCARILASTLVIGVMASSSSVFARGGGKTSADEGDGPPAVQIGKEKLFPVSVNWVADSLDGKQLWSGIDRPTIYIDKQMRMRGFDGCNMFSVTAYPLKEQKIAVGPLAIARQTCDKSVTDAERMGHGRREYPDRQRARWHGALRARPLSSSARDLQLALATRLDQRLSRSDRRKAPHR